MLLFQQGKEWQLLFHSAMACLAWAHKSGCLRGRNFQPCTCNDDELQGICITRSLNWSMAVSQKIHEKWSGPCCPRRQELSRLNWSPPTPTAPAKITAPGPVSKLSMSQALAGISNTPDFLQKHPQQGVSSHDFYTSSSQPNSLKAHTSTQG